MAADPNKSTLDPTVLRRRWLVGGRVQGVGFRPHVARVATAMKLDGYVQNTSAGVTIELQGAADAIEAFERALLEEAPLAARPHIAGWVDRPALPATARFEILSSQTDAVPTAGVTPDLSICPSCLAEVMDPTDRRRGGYPLTNCTQCGPRYSILRGIPYDRRSTTMAAFELCPDCRGEYEAPSDRRFHAQPTACHACGPKAWFVRDDERCEKADAIAAAAKVLADGGIVAVKGVGGYHLAARADDDAAVARLRDRKHRRFKPFAVMARSVEVAERLASFSVAGRMHLVSPAAPIVLARRQAGGRIAESVAPGQLRLGVMVPYTPLHHLLFAELPAKIDALVMTSANDSDEPLIYADGDAADRLAGLADAILGHERPIERAVDDSVVLDRADASPVVIRRSRGFAPSTIAIPGPTAEPGLCVGADLKNTIALVRQGEAILSQHLGDLSNLRSVEAMRRAVDDLLRLLEVSPRWISHDLHPGYLGTHLAREMAGRLDVPLVGVQHHHAHAAAVLAEHGLTGPAVAIVCDGTGYGTDGTIWGGEVLVSTLGSFERVACLTPMPLPGGDAAARHPWRCGLMLAERLGLATDDPIVAAMVPDAGAAAFVRRMIATGTSCTLTSSAGRLFDGVAALLGLASDNAYEAFAAQMLENAADTEGFAAGYGIPAVVAVERGNCTHLDPLPLVRSLVEGRRSGVAAGPLAAAFHARLGEGFAHAAVSVARQRGISTVVLGGGAMVNERLARTIRQTVEASGLTVLESIEVPPGDGGLSYGQAAVATARMYGGLPCV